MHPTDFYSFLALQTEGKGYAAFWWFWLQESFERLSGAAPLMVLDLTQEYTNPKEVPTHVKNFRRVPRAMDDCRRLSNSVRGRQMVEFKRRYSVTALSHFSLPSMTTYSICNPA